MSKKKSNILLACFVAVLLICVVIVGMIVGEWPLNQDKDPADGYTDIHSNQTTSSEENTYSEDGAAESSQTDVIEFDDLRDAATYGQN